MLHDEPVGAGFDRHGLDRIADFCSAAVRRIQMDAVAVTFANELDGLELVHASDALAETIAQLELALGQGPSFDARMTGLPCIAADLTGSVSEHRWPLFATEASNAAVRAVHAYPLIFPAGAIGTVTMYSKNPGGLSSEQHRQAQAVAELIGLAMVGPGSGESIGSGLRMTVHQAAGMVMQQTGLGIQDALVLLRSTAFNEDARMTDLAAEVISGKRRFRKVVRDVDQ
jgi:hypothetical protein